MVWPAPPSSILKFSSRPGFCLEAMGRNDVRCGFWGCRCLPSVRKPRKWTCWTVIASSAGKTLLPRPTNCATSLENPASDLLRECAAVSASVRMRTPPGCREKERTNSSQSFRLAADAKEYVLHSRPQPLLQSKLRIVFAFRTILHHHISKHAVLCP